MSDTELTPLQKAFCIEFLKDHNATQSAIRAGYSKKGASVRGSELLAKRKILEYIQDLHEQNIMSVVEIKSILTDIARGKVDGGGVNDRINALKELGKIFQITTTTRLETWETELIRAIELGTIKYEDVEFAVISLGKPKATADELFRLANVPIDSSPS